MAARFSRARRRWGSALGAVAVPAALLVTGASPHAQYAAPAAKRAAASPRYSGPSLAVGVVEESVRQPTVARAKAKLRLVRQAGFDTVNVTETWALGETSPPPGDVVALRNVHAAARSLGMHVILSVYPSGSSQTPLTEEADDQFAAFTTALVRAVGAREVIVGNEPNLNRFWLPQFGSDGSDAAAPAYLALLERTFHALEALDPSIVVDGGALSAHGSDRPDGLRQTHSPTEFLTDLGSAYRASAPRAKVMDAFDIHPYESESNVPPATKHPLGTTIAIADYDKLAALLGRAFEGTPQPGAKLPIVYGEFGVESTIPAAERHLYTGTEPSTTRPVDELTQGRYYREAIALAFCQPTVRTLLLFHAFDEPSLAGWQSGVYYANGAPKRSLPIVRAAIEEARRGIIAVCPGLRLTPNVRRIVWPHGRLAAGAPLGFSLACSIDCRYRARLEAVSGGVVAVVSGRLVRGTLHRVELLRRARAGRFRVRVSLVAPVNPGPPRELVSPAFVVR